VFRKHLFWILRELIRNCATDEGKQRRDARYCLRRETSPADYVGLATAVAVESTARSPPFPMLSHVFWSQKCSQLKPFNLTALALKGERHVPLNPTGPVLSHSSADQSSPAVGRFRGHLGTVHGQKADSHGFAGTFPSVSSFWVVRSNSSRAFTRIPWRCSRYSKVLCVSIRHRGPLRRWPPMSPRDFGKCQILLTC
jgi:hypothetical protein